MTPEERALLIKRYKDGGSAFLEALNAVPEAALDSAPAGEWSAREIAHHVADAELVRGYRLRQLLAQDAPRIQAFDEAQFAARLHYYRPVQASLSLFKAAVASNLELLVLALPEEWLRPGQHDEAGPFTLEDLLERAANHCFDHSEQVRKLSGHG
jgi:hypothetical protein